jgi:hypothetical protein
MNMFNMNLSLRNCWSIEKDVYLSAISIIENLSELSKNGWHFLLSVYISGNCLKTGG